MVCTLAAKLTHSQLGGDARGLCSLVARPSTNLGQAEAQSWLQEHYGARGSYSMESAITR